MSGQLFIISFVLLIGGFLVWGLFFAGQEFSDIRNLNSWGSNIIAFGDSLTAGGDVVSPSETWPALVSNVLLLPVINAGRNGDGTESALLRLEDDVLANDPRIVIVLLGGNDFLQQIPKEETLQNLEAIIQKIQERGAMVVLVGLRLGIIKDEYKEGFEELARQYRTAYVPQILDGILRNPTLMSEDNIHPNAEGHQIIAERIEKVLRPLIKAARR